MTKLTGLIKNTTEQLKRLEWKNFIWLTLAGIVCAVGITVFLSPVKLLDGGVSGTSMILSTLVPTILSFPSFSIFLLLLNFPLFMFGGRKRGITFSLYSRYAITVYSVSSWIITHVLPIETVNASPLAGRDIVLCAIFGGVLVGAGRGLTMRFGGAMDGIEVLAVLFAKRLGLSLGTFEMMYNVVLYLLCGIMTGSWLIPLYSIIAYAASLKTIDYVVEGVDRAKSVMIVTDKPDEVGDALLTAFERGATKIAAKGGYSNADKTVIYFVVNRFQLPKLRNVIYSADRNAYVTVSDVADVIRMSATF